MYLRVVALQIVDFEQTTIEVWDLAEQFNQFKWTVGFG